MFSSTIRPAASPAQPVLMASHRREPLGITETTRNTLAAGGFLLAAAGLGALIWSANRKAYKPKRRVLVYRGRGRQQMMTLP